MAYGLRMCILDWAYLRFFSFPALFFVEVIVDLTFPIFTPSRSCDSAFTCCFFTCLYELWITGFMLQNASWLSVNLSCITLGNKFLFQVGIHASSVCILCTYMLNVGYVIDICIDLRVRCGRMDVICCSLYILLWRIFSGFLRVISSCRRVDTQCSIRHFTVSHL